MTTTSEAVFFVGIDAGGTHCRATLQASNGQTLGEGRSGPANIANNFEQSLHSMVSAVTNAIENADLPSDTLQNVVVGAGVAGLHLPDLKEKLSQWDHPFKAFYFTTDLWIATLAAHGKPEGAMIILGTGFSALGLINQEVYAIGGYGFPINANGSGSWFGLEAVKAVLLAVDEVGPSTQLTEKLLANHTALSLATVLQNAPAQQFAQFAPLVFECAQAGDDVSLSLIRDAAEFVQRVMQRFIHQGIHNIAFCGGVAPVLMPWLDASFTDYIVPAKAKPEHGALLFAQQHFAQQPLSNAALPAT
ncbi:BadF/BadG/BcrA/BcrD ATPase family protein [Marinibactrum halimedae]|uniref:ATPase BadF/BadG/BcrA/BcrD type domain-containing protein n=1 Tax=Marinibactrum halimedae TaxID=1444977 RepID=A0AA37T8D3_9GAMM|nr:BadF/BadG/BcrA/BcrD ATPase family protein [Marinibactrum halimedae]MCD9460710.1 ATPase [Marinibactrum halimedae]GLS25165.1 hypothetical protein GCM10007877_08790 [Marinibactrum halimedae]